MITRRRFATGACATFVACRLDVSLAAAGELTKDLAETFGRIEAESQGRLGVAILDTASGTRAGHRADERFPMCSTFKLLAAGTVLARVDAGQERLERHVTIAAGDLVPYSPITEKHVDRAGMSLGELCEAALTVSDNTAGNLLLRSLGGPAALTRYARSLGDAATRLDRIEPDLNEALPDDPRDTTTPAAMLENLRRLAVDDALLPASRQQLIAWLTGSKTGDARLRAGMPKEWRVGDKTGTGDRGTTNDVAVIWPPQRAPAIVAAYLTGASPSGEQRDAALAAVGRAVADALSR
ncbi:MAG: putative beta-lactamase [Rhodospirillales bacterium]|nr:putative beta-lactamase [Rhodospirillales bacterium]